MEMELTKLYRVLYVRVPNKKAHSDILGPVQNVDNFSGGHL